MILAQTSNFLTALPTSTDHRPLNATDDASIYTVYSTVTFADKPSEDLQRS